MIRGEENNTTRGDHKNPDKRDEGVLARESVPVLRDELNTKV